MGFYFDMLKEQDELLGNTGFDDNMIGTPDEYEVKLTDVEKATVEDINKEYSDEAEQKELDGQDLCCNPVEEAAIAIYESECNWNMIMKAMGTHEVTEAARGRVAIMEAADVKGFFASVKKFFTNLWEKISNTVNGWCNNMKSIVAREKGKIDKKFYDAVRAGETKYKGKGFKGYDFAKKTGVAVDKLFADMKKENDSANQVINTFMLKANEENGLENAAAAASSIRKTPDQIRGAFCGAESVNADEFSKKLHTALFGSDKIQLRGENQIADSAKADYIIGVLQDGNGSVGKVLKAYAELRVSFSKLFATLNKLEKAITKAEKGGAKIGSVANEIKVQKEVKNACFTVLVNAMRAMMAERAQARKIANIYAAAGKKKDEKKPEAQKESYSGAFAGLQMV